MRLSRNVRRFSQPLSITNCTDKLRQNDPGFVELSLERVGDDFDLPEFCHALRYQNHTVRHVCFSGTFVRELQVHQWRTLLEHVGYLCTLQELQIWCSTIPVDVLARTITNATRLNKIYLFRINLAGNQQDFDDLAIAVRNHAALRDVRISGFQIVQPQQQVPVQQPQQLEPPQQQEQQPPEQQQIIQGEVNPDQHQHNHQNHHRNDRHLHHNNDHDNNPNTDISLDSLLEAFAAVRTLQVLSLQLSGVPPPPMILATTAAATNGNNHNNPPNNGGPPFSGSSLARLMCSSTLQNLYLSRLGLLPEHYAVIALGLWTSHNLMALDLFGNHVENDQFVLLVQALAKNQSLETLVLPCPTNTTNTTTTITSNDNDSNKDNTNLTLESCAALADALKRNTKLHTLNLPRSTVSEEGLLLIAQALATDNTSLKKIELGLPSQLGPKGTHALQKMLEKNYALEKLILSSVEKSIQEQVEYYLRLNEVGRGTLLKQDGKATATREQWVSMLISVIHDLDCLFYFCSCNPGLFQLANAKNVEVIVTEEIRLPKRRHTINHFSHYSSQQHQSQHSTIAAAAAAAALAAAEAAGKSTSSSSSSSSSSLLLSKGRRRASALN